MNINNSWQECLLHRSLTTELVINYLRVDTIPFKKCFCLCMNNLSFVFFKAIKKRNLRVFPATNYRGKSLRPERANTFSLPSMTHIKCSIHKRSKSNDEWSKLQSLCIILALHLLSSSLAKQDQILYLDCFF